ncbi:MAG: hypothetical protein LVQ95_00125 [Candidatus Micrarchaeales archaeon]|nr:hypothetical protein [Candidatus Micrarchaeales archaeon]
MFEGVLVFGILIGVFIASLAIAIGVIADTKSNRELKVISKKMLVSGAFVLAISVIFAVM